MQLDKKKKKLNETKRVYSVGPPHCTFDIHSFTVSYHKSLGFMVQAINNTKTNFEEDGAFWQIFEYNPSVSVGSRHICYGTCEHT